MKDTTTELASRFLGKRVESAPGYDPSLLVPIPRSLNRTQYSINSDNLPFEGFDLWRCYEFSSLSEQGLPVTSLLQLYYPATSPNIVESKSLKLYLNSFNMERNGRNTQECLDICQAMIQRDLSAALGANVVVRFLSPEVPVKWFFSSYTTLLQAAGEDGISITHFKESPELLKASDGEEKEYCYCFDSLRSNCRVTHQPDFGDLFIYYKSNRHVDEKSLVEYLVSFRGEFHFHEECVEMIFKRLYDVLGGADAELMVTAMYTRRGGIDINPARWTRNCRKEVVYEVLGLQEAVRAIGSIKQ